jgi:peptidoglycan-associated lipoprotein
MKHTRILSTAVLSLAVLATAACSKKVAKVTPPPPPPPAAAPTVTLAASPDVIQEGDSTQLTWQSQNADTLTIPGIGTVPASGSRTVNPQESTTYTITAKGPGGSTDATARVTVNAKPVAAIPQPSDEELFAKAIKDVFFDYDKSEVRSDQSVITNANADFLKQHPNMKILIAGHCDERGSDEYNLALGTSRANSVKQQLVQEGISAERIQTISYGKEKPFCSESDEQCWQQNRRDHFSLAQ